MFKHIKQACCYDTTVELDLRLEELDEKLASFAFAPPSEQELSRCGWIPPFNSNWYALPLPLDGLVSPTYLLALHTQEKVLPTAELNIRVSKRLGAIEAETGAPVGKKAAQDIKHEEIHKMLPQAFSNYKTIYLLLNKDRVWVLAGMSQAENALAHLRKALGSLPVVPLHMKGSGNQVLFAQWLLRRDLPEDIEPTEQFKIKQHGDGGKLSGNDLNMLGDPEQFEAVVQGNSVEEIGLYWDSHLSFVWNLGLEFKSLKWGDMLIEQNDDIDKAAVLQRVESDFGLIAGTLNQLVSKFSDFLFKHGDEQE